MKKGKKQLAAWFWRQTGKASQPIAGAEHFAGLIRLLGNVGHAPHRIPLYKFYMTHPDFEDECHRVFLERWSSRGLDQKFRLHFQCQVAEELFNQESEEVKARIEMEAAEHLEEKLSTYKQLMSGEKLTFESLNEFGEMSKEICRQNLVKFLQPLLDTLRLLTDLSFFLVAGAPPTPGAAKDEFTVLTVSSGSTVGPDPKKFEEFNRDDFTKNVIGQFLVFLLKTAEDEEEGGKQTVNKEKSKRQKRGKKKKSTEVVEEGPVEADEPQSSGSPEPQSPANEPQSSGSSPAPIRPRPRPRPRALTPMLHDGWNLHPETDAYLKTLSDDDRRKALREIKGHSKADFDRNNNIYKMKFLLKEIDKKHERMANQSSSTTAPNNETWGDEIADKWARASGQSLEELIDNSEWGVSSQAPSFSLPPEATFSAPSTTSDVPSITAPEDVPLSVAPQTDSLPLPSITAPEDVPLSVAPQTDSLPFPSIAAPEDVPLSVAPQTDSSPFPGSPSAQQVRSTTPIASTSEHGDTTERRIVPYSSGSPPVIASDNDAVSVPGIVGVDKTGWPAWLSSAFDVFNSLRGHVLWSRALKDWTELERKYSFANPVGAAAFYSAVSRPELISWWSKNGKKVREEPPDIIADVSGFGEGFWSWWSVINPQ
ncbi:hypothetical protein VKT23_010111 [Stygiomarasmius scandens]|uniref:Uncharacterized protein n=1 Tax=Marasmiellus scandens TaxID=2682957 RepID=A0ABR1JD23_9AGAR